MTDEVNDLMTQYNSHQTTLQHQEGNLQGLKEAINSGREQKRIEATKTHVTTFFAASIVPVISSIEEQVASFDTATPVVEERTAFSVLFSFHQIPSSQSGVVEVSPVGV